MKRKSPEALRLRGFFSRARAAYLTEVKKMPEGRLQRLDDAYALRLLKEMIAIRIAATKAIHFPRKMNTWSGGGSAFFPGCMPCS
jgi:hypothetical protein